APLLRRSASGHSRSRAIRKAGSESSRNRCPFVSADACAHLQGGPGYRVPPIPTRAAAQPFLPGQCDYGRQARINVGRSVAALLRALLGGALLLDRAPVAAVLEELRGPLRGDRFDGIARSQAGVRLAVGHVGAEAAFLEHDRLLADRILAE